MLEWLYMEQWPPYAVGISIGILSWFTFIFSDQAISCSNGISKSSGMLERLFRGKAVLERAYYKKFPPNADWKWIFLVGVILGSFFSSIASGTFQIRWVPEIWNHALGGAVLPRLITAFIGGILMGFTSRWANGCTSGHGISGTIQMAVSSWISIIFFFIGGIGCAMILYHLIGV